MRRVTDSDLLEVIDMYEQSIEKQSEVISQMSQLIKRQATELAELRNMLRMEIREDS